LVIYSVWPQCTPYHLEQLPNPTISISHRVELCTHPSQTPQREPFSINCNLGNLVNEESLCISRTTHDTSTLIISGLILKSRATSFITSSSRRVCAHGCRNSSLYMYVLSSYP
jgi:hypothetical protein